MPSLRPCCPAALSDPIRGLQSFRARAYLVFRRALAAGVPCFSLALMAACAEKRRSAAPTC